MVLPRRLAIPLPPFCDRAKQALHRLVSGLVGRSGVPLHVRRLLGSVVMCAPAAALKVGDVFRGGPKPRSPLWVVQALRQRVASEHVVWEGNTEPVGYKVLRWDEDVRAGLASEMMTRVRSERCDCRSLMAAAPRLQNECGHIICKSESQWGHMLDSPPH